MESFILAWCMRTIRDLPGLNLPALRDLKAIGITTPEELLHHFPSRYEDFSQERKIGSLRGGETVTVRGTVKKISGRRIPGRRLVIIEATILDETGELSVSWFNLSYLLRAIPVGTIVSLSGEIKPGGRRLTMRHPVVEKRRSEEALHTGRIVPIYPLSGTLTQGRIRAAIAALLRSDNDWRDWLPEKIRNEHNLLPFHQALRVIHFPDSFEQAAAAKRRLQFNELFLYELAQFLSRRELKRYNAPRIPADFEFLRAFVESLPFSLTTAQRRAGWQIIRDMERGQPMNRLLQGDVGSGKTVVAALAALHAVRAGFSVVLLAPTELLTEQHFRTLSSLISSRAKVGLHTRSHKSETAAAVIVGTHALLQDNVSFERLGLVIVDEQHRFGVRQRQTLQKKEPVQNSSSQIPHLLSMTATPIPRTLALTLYGDLDLSTLDELPRGRRPITTRLVKAGEEEQAWAAVRRELDAGHQAFVVCPLIDPSDALGVRSVTELERELFPGQLNGYTNVVIHGRLKSKEREERMAAFSAGRVQVLLATTVIEVGVDVPKATVIWIEGAERFGLAQLHQLRGRVGRSSMASYCFLRPTGFVSEKTFERLLAVVKSQDGFALAEKDLALRGPGDVYGTMQSGFPEFKIADVFDLPLVSRARQAAERLLENDPALVKHPAVHERVRSFIRSVHFE